MKKDQDTGKKMKTIGKMTKLERKLDIHKKLFSLYLTKEVPEDILKLYFGGLRKRDNEGFRELQEFIVNHLKPEVTFLTGYGIIESVEKLIETTVENGNMTMSYKKIIS